MRFVPDPRERQALVAWLQETALPKAIARPGMVGAAAAENDLEVANAPLQDKSMDHPKADEAEWVVLLEGADAGAVGAAARRLHAGDAEAFRRFGGADDRHLPAAVRQSEMRRATRVSSLDRAP